MSAGSLRPPRFDRFDARYQNSRQFIGFLHYSASAYSAVEKRARKREVGEITGVSRADHWETDTAEKGRSNRSWDSGRFRDLLFEALPSMKDNALSVELRRIGKDRS